MEIEVDFISKDFIKPSSPTPNHLRKLKFSFIDQIQITVSMPCVIFYEKSNISNQQRCNLLKKSISKVLTIFYPMAGRINNHSYVDCNDEGALFVEAKANCNLSYILQNRSEYHNHNKKFIPSQLSEGVHQYGSLFQITYFNCGGTAVSFSMPHMLGDGLSQVIFLNSWAAVAQGNKVDIPFVSDTVFPQKLISGLELSQWVFKENVVTKPFVFDAFTISTLQDKYSKNGEKLSRVQALYIFLFSRIMASFSQSKDSMYLLINAVNVRELLDPPLPKQSFGNIAWAGTTLIDNMCKEDEIAKRIKDSITSVNAESVKKLQNGELGFAKETFIDSLKGVNEIARYTFTSLCNFPLYIDLGWGNPEWLTTCGMIIDNLVLCVDTKEGRGIEAWISLAEEDMTKFEKDEQLLSHMSSTYPYGNPNLNSRL